MEPSDVNLSVFTTNVNQYEQVVSTRRYCNDQHLICRHCSSDVDVERDEEQYQNEIYVLRDRAKSLEKRLDDYKPVELFVKKVFNSLNEWRKQMNEMIDESSEQVQLQMEQFKNEFNHRWKVVKENYLHMLIQLAIEPIDQLLKVRRQIDRNQINKVHTQLNHVENEVKNLLKCDDLVRVNFDLCSLTGDIQMFYGCFPSLMPIPSSNSCESSHHLDRMKLLYRLDSFSNDSSPFGCSSHPLNNSTEIFVTWKQPSTLVVFDLEQRMIKCLDIEPSFRLIYDIIWSDYLNVFLLAGHALYTFHIINNQVKLIFTTSHLPMWSITTHKTNLFICYMMGESSVIEHRSLSSFQLIVTYSRRDLFPFNTSSTIDIVRCIRSDDQYIAMTIRNLTTYQWRVDIFNIHLQRLFKGQNLGYSAHSDYWCCFLTSYRSFSWLIINNTSKQQVLILIDQQANIEQKVEQDGFNLSFLQQTNQLIIKDRQGLAIFTL